MHCTYTSYQLPVVQKIWHLKKIGIIKMCTFLYKLSVQTFHIPDNLMYKLTQTTTNTTRTMIVIFRGWLPQTVLIDSLVLVLITMVIHPYPSCVVSLLITISVFLLFFVSSWNLEIYLKKLGIENGSLLTDI